MPKTETEFDKRLELRISAAMQDKLDMADRSAWIRNAIDQQLARDKQETK